MKQLTRTQAQLLSLGIAILVGVLLWLNTQTDRSSLKQTQIPPAPNLPVAPFVGLGDAYAGGWLLTFWLQAQDSQVTGEVPFRHLNYHHIAQWLDQINWALPEARYPIFNAVFVYGAIQSDPTKAEQMYLQARKLFLSAPQQRWYDYAMATVLAHRKLHNMPLALKMAEDLFYHAPKTAPEWIRFMKIYLLRNTQQTTLAAQLAREAIDKGLIKSPDEAELLKQVIQQLESQN